MDKNAAYEALKTRLGPRGWSDDPDIVSGRTRDWRGRYRGATPLLVRPADTAETADVVRICASAGLAILPQGGNTGLVGGSTPQGEILLSTARMRAVRDVDPQNASLVVEAGAPLTVVQEAADEVKRLFPLSLGSQGTATIGGLISTNAGGVHVVRYGMMRDLVLGLEVVLPDGRVLDALRTLRKDNTGYDLKQLFIGAEGTLGIVTAAALKLFPRPGAQAVAFCALPDAQTAPALLSHLQDETGGAVTAFELISGFALDLTLKHMEGARPPLERTPEWAALVELSFGAGLDASAAAETAIGEAYERGLVEDATIAQNDSNANDFWALREAIPEAERHHGPALKHDVSVPVSSVPAFLQNGTAAAKAALPGVDIIAFGHVGDGNVHFNVAMPAGMDRETFFADAAGVSRAVYDAAHALGGSLSAEHGIGVMKIDELAARRPLEVEVMARIKDALDPDNLMNPRVLLKRPTVTAVERVR